MRKMPRKCVLKNGKLNIVRLGNVSKHLLFLLCLLNLKADKAIAYCVWDVCLERVVHSTVIKLFLIKYQQNFINSFDTLRKRIVQRLLYSITLEI